MDGGQVFEAGLAPYKLKPIAAEVYEQSGGTSSCNILNPSGGNKLVVHRPAFSSRAATLFLLGVGDVGPGFQIPEGKGWGQVTPKCESSPMAIESLQWKGEEPVSQF